MKSRKTAPRYIINNATSPPKDHQYPCFITKTKQWQLALFNYTSRSKDLQYSQQKIGCLYGNKINQFNTNEKNSTNNNNQYIKITTKRLQTTKVDELEIQDKERTETIRALDKKLQDETVQASEKKEDQQLDFQKIGVLKRILEHYNLKNLKRKHYESNLLHNQELIGTFGLRIQSVKYEQNSRTKEKLIKRDRNSATIRRLNQINSQRKQTQSSPPNRNTLNQNKHNYIDYIRETFKLEQKLNENKKQQRKFSKQTKIQNYDLKRNSLIMRRPSTGQKQQKVLKEKEKQKQKEKEKPLKYTSDKDSFQIRLKKFKQFLFLINFSNQIYRNMQMEDYQIPLKYFVGKGNNGNLIHSVMKKRFWFVQTDIQSQANFVWTQIKIESIFKKQQNCQNQFMFQKNQEKKFDLRSDRKLTITSPTKRGARMYEPINPYLKILSTKDYKSYNEVIRFLENSARNDFQHKIKYMKKQLKVDLNQNNRVIHNHLPANQLLGNKKAMFYCLKQYYKLINKDVFTILPLTFHIQDGIRDDQFKKFIGYYNQRKKLNKPNIWIIKPGEQTNRGNGISCSNKLDQIRRKISTSKKIKRTFIIQSYITRPFLYFRRKFDIRAYMLTTMNNGILKGYWYQQGYIRTSSSIFDLEQLQDPMIHLTNDAVQKNGDEYGRFEQGNKLTYNQLERYLESIGSKFNFYQMVYPQMRRIATDSIRSTALFLDPKKKQNNFEIFGLDFMIDENFKVWLIQINTNPCLELSCGILERLIPHMVQNAFRIGLDPIFPPPNNFLPSRKYNISQNALFYNKFELIFDEIRDGEQLKQLYMNTKLLQIIGIVSQDKEQYENDGQIIQIENQ